MDNAPASSLNCPAGEELTEFVTGNLSGAAFQRLAQHVEACSTCAAALEQFDATADGFLTQVRQAAIQQPMADQPVPQDLLAVARSCYSPRGIFDHGPRRLGKFELLEELGIGSFGHVFRARDTEAGRTVAVKMLRAGRLAGREEIDRFVREARSAAQLQHPGLVPVYETGQTEDGVFFLVEEFIQGETLSARLASGRFSFRQMAELVAAVGDALDYAHRHGVIHRDVKPSNILLDGDGRPHLMDFGLAKHELDETPVTVDGQFLGTPAYVSPEQARGDLRHVDGRTDVYSLGVIFYELLTGERPFRGNRQMLLLQLLYDEPRPPRQLNDKIPRELETICLKALGKSPARRYASAGDLAADLRHYLQGEPIRARPVGRVERLWRWCRRHPVAAGLLLAMSLNSAFGVWQLARLSGYLVRTSALESAAQQSEILEAINSFYSADVVERAKVKGVEATHDYLAKKDAIPLPATLTIDLGRLVSVRSESGVQVRLYSDHPFRTRQDGGPKDDFELDALAVLRETPATPYYRFEDYQGWPALRYATAQRMQATCVQCHNNHNDSTKKDWKEGEVVGVLEIIRPLDRDVVRARNGLRGTLILMGAISGSLVGTSALILYMRNRRRDV